MDFCSNLKVPFLTSSTVKHLYFKWPSSLIDKEPPYLNRENSPTLPRKFGVGTGLVLSIVAGYTFTGLVEDVVGLNFNFLKLYLFII